MYPPAIDHKCMVYCYTTEVAHVPQCTYTKALLQLTIDVWNTTTLNKFHRQQNAHIPRPPSSN